MSDQISSESANYGSIVRPESPEATAYVAQHEIQTQRAGHEIYANVIMFSDDNQQIALSKKNEGRILVVPRVGVSDQFNQLFNDTRDTLIADFEIAVDDEFENEFGVYPNVRMLPIFERSLWTSKRRVGDLVINLAFGTDHCLPPIISDDINLKWVDFDYYRRNLIRQVKYGKDTSIPKKELGFVEAGLEYASQSSGVTNAAHS